MRIFEEIGAPPILALLAEAAVILLTSLVPATVPALFKDSVFLIASVAILCTIWFIALRTYHRRSCLLVALFLVAGTAFSGSLVWFGGLAVYEDVYPAPKVVELPKVKVRLVPEAVAGERLNFHILIQNDGPGDIEVTLSSFRIPGDYQADFHSPNRRMIRAGDDLSVPIHALNRFLSVKRGIFQFQYRVLSQNGSLRHAQYAFQLPDVMSGPISPTSSEDEAGFGNFESEAAFFEQKFAMPTAGLGYGFPETIAGKPNTFQFAFHGRSVIVNATNRDVYFATPQNGRWRVLYGKMAVTNDAHHDLLVAWSDPDNFLVGNLDTHPMKELSHEELRRPVRQTAQGNGVWTAP